MKKSKVIIAIALVIIFVVLCMNAPTFSWFSRSEHLLEGDEIMLNTNKAYTAYNGGGYSNSGNSNSVVTFSNEKSTDGVNYVSASTADLSAPTTSPQDVQFRKYFRTTLINNTGTPQNVSLFIKKLSIPTSTATTINSDGKNGSLAIGVNGPTRNYRDYTALTNKNYTLFTGYTKRIYIQVSGYLQNVGWGGVQLWATYGGDYGEDTVGLEYIGTSDNGPTYFIDIPYHAHWFYVTVNGWKTANNGNQDNTMRCDTVSLDRTYNSMDQSVLVKILNSQTDGDYRDVENVSNHGIKAVIIKQYYKNITIAKNATFDTRLGAQQDEPNAGFSYYHSDCSVTYTSSNQSVFTVDSNGVITGVAAGEAELVTKVTGPQWSDKNYDEVRTTVTVTQNSTYDFTDEPIVRNVVVPVDDNSTQNVHENTVEVYWYIINNSTNKLVYSIDEIYVGT